MRGIPLHIGQSTAKLEKIAREELKLTDTELMQRAGQSAYDIFKKLYPNAKKVVVICGGGNNGGDGYAFAKIAKDAEVDILIAWVHDPNALKGPAKKTYQAAQKSGISIVPFHSNLTFDGQVIIDALFGTGLKGAVKDSGLEAIHWMNQAYQPVFCLDVPSGLNADTGIPQPEAVRAHNAITFMTLKQGLFTGQAKNFVRKLHFSSLGLPNALFSKIPFSAQLLQAAMLRGLPRRLQHGHKGLYGHAVLIGGGQGFSGAIHLAGEGALRAGAGKVSIITDPTVANAIRQTRPELMVYDTSDDKIVSDLLSRATVIGIGPGLGQTDWANALLATALKSKQALVLDADALHLIAQAQKNHTRDNWILTPHPGEAAALLGEKSSEAIQADRFAAVSALQKKFGGISVLKGAGTLIADGQQTYVCDLGNPGMASAGMGDVLTGVITGLVAQGFPLNLSAGIGVVAHAISGDWAANYGERGLLASDLFPYIRMALNGRVPRQQTAQGQQTGNTQPKREISASVQKIERKNQKK